MSIPTHSDYHSQNISDSNLDQDQDQHLDPDLFGELDDVFGANSTSSTSGPGSEESGPMKPHHAHPGVPAKPAYHADPSRLASQRASFAQTAMPGVLSNLFRPSLLHQPSPRNPRRPGFTFLAREVRDWSRTSMLM